MSIMKIISIDVGYSSLGLVCVVADNDYTLRRVNFAQKIDLRDIACVPGCTLRHSQNVVDRIAHFVQYYQHQFDDADTVLIEVQPLGGIRDVQALLYATFRQKAVLISPCSMHRHFGFPVGDYEGRKELSVELARPHLNHLASFRALYRKHDVADALCLALFWIQKKHKEWSEQQRLIDKQNKTMQNRTLAFDKFRFVPPTTRV